MTIITRHREDKFAIIPNAVAEDNRLSFTARGLLVYLLAKPNNWQVHIKDIRLSGGIGRDQAYKLIDELRTAGYIVVEKQNRKAKGTFAAANYVVHDTAMATSLPLPEPVERPAPCTENTDTVTPLPDFPDTDNPNTENKDAIIRTKDITIPFPLPPERLNLPRFLDLWESWPHRERPDSRPTAEALFEKLRQVDQRLAVKHAEIYRRMHVLRGLAYRMIPYLKQKGFREFEGAPTLDHRGLFEISPDRPEWEPWMRDIHDRLGDRVANVARETKIFTAKTRWPAGYVPLEQSAPASMLSKGTYDANRSPAA